MFLRSRANWVYFTFSMLLLYLLLSCFCFGVVERTASDEPAQQRFCQLAIEGQLSEELVSTFYRYVSSNAKKRIQASDEFWNWLAGQPKLQRGLWVGLHPDYNPNVIKELEQLRDTFGFQVERYPHLALALAFVYGAAKGQTIRAPWMDWVAKNRSVPSCCESFAYYLENKEKMLYPLDRFPWPLMLYVADNDVPIAERRWVLGHYKGHTINDLPRLHAEPEYVKGASARNVAKLDGAPMALSRIFSDGGVCSQQAYYACSVLKCMGVPSVRLLERSHAFEGWVSGTKRLSVTVDADYDNRKNGYFWCPLTREKQYEYEFKLLVTAIDLSYERYLKAHIGRHVFNMLPNDSKKKAFGLLDESLRANPYVVETWLTYAQACNPCDQFEKGGELFTRAGSVVSGHPELSCAILNQLTRSQLNVDGAVSHEDGQLIQNAFEKMYQRLILENRLDLAGELFGTHADFLAKTKGIVFLVDCSLEWFALKNFPTKDEKKLFKQILNLTYQSNDQKALKKLLDVEYCRRRQCIPDHDSEYYPNLYSVYVQVARALIDYYRKSGDNEKASIIHLEIDRLNRENFNLDNLPEVVRQGRCLGTVGQNVSKAIPTAAGTYVWRILYNMPKGLKVRVRVQHALSGQEGAFCLTAWSDTDRNGIPDTRIGISPLMIADKDQWSVWEFMSTEKTVFVGIVIKEKTPFYYQMGGTLEGYCGLSNRVFYSHRSDQVPQSSIQPRYINICVEILRKQ